MDELPVRILRTSLMGWWVRSFMHSFVIVWFRGANENFNRRSKSIWDGNVSFTQYSRVLFFANKVPTTILRWDSSVDTSSHGTHCTNWQTPRSEWMDLDLMRASSEKLGSIDSTNSLALIEGILISLFQVEVSLLPYGTEPKWRARNPLLNIIESPIALFVRPLLCVCIISEPSSKRHEKFAFLHSCYVGGVERMSCIFVKAIMSLIDLCFA